MFYFLNDKHQCYRLTLYKTMRISSLLFVLCILAWGCSDDNSDDANGMLSPPDLEALPNSPLQIGDTLTIKGMGFLPNETYEVGFNGTPGEIINITPTALKVIVPEEATTGPVTLTFAGNTTTIGNLDITPKDTGNPDNPTPVTTKAFIFHNSANNIYIFHEDAKRLAKIDLDNGALNYVSDTTTYGLNTRGAVFHKGLNAYIGFENLFDSAYLVIMDVATGEVSHTTVFDENSPSNDFSDLAIDSQNNVYIFHDAVDQLAQINLTTGELTYLGDRNDYGQNTSGAAYHSPSNAYIGFDNRFGDPKLIQVNVTTGATVQTSIQASFLSVGSDFDSFVIGTF